MQLRAQENKNERKGKDKITTKPKSGQRIDLVPFSNIFYRNLRRLRLHIVERIFSHRYNVSFD